jgi:hypothetical protein
MITWTPPLQRGKDSSDGHIERLERVTLGSVVELAAGLRPEGGRHRCQLFWQLAIGANYRGQLVPTSLSQPTQNLWSARCPGANYRVQAH